MSLLGESQAEESVPKGENKLIKRPGSRDFQTRMWSVWMEIYRVMTDDLRGMRRPNTCDRKKRTAIRRLTSFERFICKRKHCIDLIVSCER